jgi:hypothetical protein
VLSTVYGGGDSPIDVCPYAMTVGAHHIAFLDLFFNILPGVGAGGSLRDSKRFLGRITMVKVHHIERIFHITIGAWLVLTFSDKFSKTLISCLIIAPGAFKIFLLVR